MPYPVATIVRPLRVNVKRLNAEFLNTFVFLGQYPVHTQWPRINVEIPDGIYVSEPGWQSTMAGLGYYAALDSSTADFGISTTGNVNIDFVATHPDIRDLMVSETMAAYFSEEGRCWFENQPDICVHGYNVIGGSEQEFDPTLDGKVSYLYTATLTIRFFYDIVAIKQYGELKTVKTYQIIVPQ